MTSLASKGWAGPRESVKHPPGPVLPHCKQRTRYIKVILLGDMCVGKTSLLRRFTDGEFSEHYLPTITVEHSEREVKVDDKSYILRIVDTAGQDRFKSLTANFYRGTQICLLTFSLDNLGSFCNLSKWREEFIQFSGIEKDQDFPYVVVGNKADLDPSLKKVKNLSVQAWCEANGKVPYIETSAKTGQNVDELFMTAVKKMIEMDQQSASPFFYQGQKKTAIKDGGSMVDLTAKPYGKRRPKCCD